MELPSLNYYAILEDEIALEGLDGITIQALWTRLNDRPGFKQVMILDENSKEFLWNIILQNPDINLYVLPEPRKPLVLFDRYEHIDPDLGIILGPPASPVNIYPYCPVEDELTGIRGSCYHYKIRVDVTKIVTKLTLMEAVSQYGERLVMVASQDVRNRVLGISDCIDKFHDFPLAVYTTLERIGRSRYQGDVWHGRTGENSKTLFYHRKLLLQHKLIKKQVTHMKRLKTTHLTPVVFLPRFYIERKPKSIKYIEDLIQLLKSCPNHTLPIATVKEKMEISAAVYKKLSKISAFTTYLETLDMPYSEFCSEGGYELKSRQKVDRSVRVIRLKNASFNLDHLSQEDMTECDDEYDESFPGILSPSKMQWDKDILQQCYKFALEAGSKGVTQSGLSQEFGITRLHSRAVCKAFLKNNLAESVMRDVGRQRTTWFVAKKFVTNSSITQEFKEEKEKMMANLSTVTKKNKKENIHEISATPSSELVDGIEVEVNSDVFCQSEVKSKEDCSLNKSLSCKRDLCLSTHGSLTTRCLKRINIILDAIKKYRIIAYVGGLQKMIVEAEKNEGLTTKMDRRSLLRILDKLCGDKHIKIILLRLKRECKLRHCHIILDPSLSVDDPEVKSVIGYHRSRFLAGVIMPDGELKFDNSVNHSIQEFGEVDPKIDATLGSKHFETKSNRYPKYLRLQAFHELLVYLAYCYSGNTNLNQKVAWDELCESSQIDSAFYKEQIDSLKVYQNVLSWSSFIPPVPNHSAPKGWLLLSDIILRLPLCIFLKVVNGDIISREIEDMYGDPLKKNVLVKDLSIEIRSVLFRRRNYVAKICELVKYLIFMGLLQYGQKPCKPSEYLFIFVNRKAVLYDTTTSSPGYHLTSSDIEYKKVEYCFNAMDDVTVYWMTMWKICMETPLGGQGYVVGRMVNLRLRNKPELVKELSVTEFSEASERDVGYIPGDGRGAAGFDSALFAHIRRNWTFPIDEDLPFLSLTCLPGVSAEVTDLIKSRKLYGRTHSRMHTWFPPFYKTHLEKTLPIPPPRLINTTEVLKKRKRMRCSEQNISKPAKKVAVAVQDETPEEKRANRKKPVHDETDEKALKQMKKRRVKWTSMEDSLLLLCRVAFLFLKPVIKSTVDPLVAYRDLLHKHFPFSRDKTSRACHRRLVYILRNPLTVENVSVFLEEIQRDSSFVKDFLDAPSTGEHSKKSFYSTFQDLCERISKKFVSTDEKGCLELPDSLDELYLRFSVTFSKISPRKAEVFSELTDIEEIKIFAIQSLLISSLCCKFDKEPIAYQLYMAYQSYPGSLLKKAIRVVRESKLVAYKKSYCRSSSSPECLPLTSSPFQLSVIFYNLFSVIYSPKIYQHCWDLWQVLVKKREACAPSMEEDHGSTKNKSRKKSKSKGQSSPESGETPERHANDDYVQLEVTNEGGFCALVVSLLAGGNISFDVELPDHILIADSSSSSSLLEAAGEPDTGRFSEINKPALQFSSGQTKKRTHYEAKIDDSDDEDDDVVIKVAPSKFPRMSSETSIGIYHDQRSSFVKGKSEIESEDNFPDCLDKTNDVNDSNEEFGDDVDETSNEDSDTDDEQLDDEMEEINEDNVDEDDDDDDDDDNFIEHREDAQDELLLAENLDSSENAMPTQGQSYSVDVGLVSNTEKEAKSSEVIESADKDAQFVVLPTSDKPCPRIVARSRVSLMKCSSLIGNYSAKGALICAQDQIHVKTCTIWVHLISILNEDIMQALSLPTFAQVTDLLLNRKHSIICPSKKLADTLKDWQVDERSEEATLPTLIYNFVESFGIIGAPHEDITNNFSDRDAVNMCVMKLEKAGLLVPVGIISLHWITAANCIPWCIRTSQIKHAVRRRFDAFRIQGVYCVDSDENPDEVALKQGDDDDDSPVKLKSDSDVNSESSQIYEGAQHGDRLARKTRNSAKKHNQSSEGSIPVQRHVHILQDGKLQRGETTSKMEEKATEYQSTFKHDEIFVLVRPWIRLDGTLNRRVFDRLLQSVLSYIMEKPGVTSSKIVARFSPALTAPNVAELLEFLMQLKCITAFRVQRPHTTSLFSKPALPSLESVDAFSYKENLLYNPAYDAVLKLSAFIGDKKYTHDFLSENKDQFPQDVANKDAA